MVSISSSVANVLQHPSGQWESLGSWWSLGWGFGKQGAPQAWLCPAEPILYLQLWVAWSTIWRVWGVSTRLRHLGQEQNRAACMQSASSLHAGTAQAGSGAAPRDRVQSAPSGPDQRKVPEGQGSRGPVGRSYLAPRRCGRPPIPTPFAVWADAPEASSPSRPFPFTPGEPPFLLPARYFQILPWPGISIKWELEYSVNEETSTSCYTHRLLWGGRYRPPFLRVNDEPLSHGKTSAVRSLRVAPSTRVSAPSVVRPIRPLVRHCPSLPQEPLPKSRCPADPRGCEQAPGDGGNCRECS